MGVTEEWAWSIRREGQLAHVLADPCSSPRCQTACLCFACCSRERSERKGPSLECSRADPPRRATGSLAVQLRSSQQWACRWPVVFGMFLRHITKVTFNGSCENPWPQLPDNPFWSFASMQENDAEEVSGSSKSQKDSPFGFLLDLTANGIC